MAEMTKELKTPLRMFALRIIDDEGHRVEDER